MTDGNTTGLVPTDAGSADDPLRRVRDALTLFNQTAKTACDLSEHQLQRVAEDAAARCVSFITNVEKQRALEERLRGGEGVGRQDEAAAEEMIAADLSYDPNR